MSYFKRHTRRVKRETKRELRRKFQEQKELSEIPYLCLLAGESRDRDVQAKKALMIMDEGHQVMD